MGYFVGIGGLLAAWTLLLVFSGERQRQINEIEIQHQVRQAEAEEAARNKKLPPHRRKKQ